MGEIGKKGEIAPKNKTAMAKQDILLLTPAMCHVSPDIRETKADSPATKTETDTTELMSKLKDVRAKLRQSNDLLRARDEELFRVQSELNDAQKDLSRQHAQTKTLNTRLSNALDDLGTAEYKLSAFQDEMAMKQLVSAARTESQYDFAARQNELSASVDGLKEKLSQAQTHLDQLASENQRVKLRLQNAESERYTLKAREGVVKNTLEAARVKLLEMRKRAEETRAENILVVAKNKALMRQQDELLAQLERAQSSGKSSNWVA